MSLTQINPDQVRAHVESICQSAGFSRSEALCKLLRTIVEESLAGRPESLKESVLSSELYRDKKYDSRLDSRVRVDASNLRARLAKYYATAGSGDGIRIEIPKGAYVAVFHRQDLPKAARPPRKSIKLLLACVLVSLLVLWWVTRTPARGRLSFQSS